MPQVDEFKYLSVLFMHDEKEWRETDRWIGAVAVVMWTLYRSIVVKRVKHKIEAVDQHQYIYLWPQALGRVKNENEVMETNRRN